MSRAAALALGTVLAVASALLLLTGASPTDLLLFGLFEVLFALAPGIGVYRALSARPGSVLEHVCIGAGVGHGLALSGFVATALIGARPLFVALPLVTLPAAAVAWRRHGRELAPGPGFNHAQLATLTVIVLAAIGLFSLGSVSQNPLPQETPSVRYYPDLVWGLSFAAEAEHHWPMTTPQVSGTPLRYHTFAFTHMAAVAQVTGIELPLIVLRMVPLALILLLALQLAFGGWRFTGRAWAGPLAAALLLLVGDLHLGVDRPGPLLGAFFTQLYLSPSAAFGMVVFVPTVAVIAGFLGGPARKWVGAGDAVVLVVLLAACAGAKASILPVLLGGLALFGLWTAVRRGPIVPVCIVALLTLTTLVVSYALLYTGSRGASTIDPLRTGVLSSTGSFFRPAADGGGALGVLALAAGSAVTALALLAPLAGLTIALRRGRNALTAEQLWLLALLVAAVVAFFLLSLPGFSQYYFLSFGVVCGAFVAADGLLEGLGRWSGHGRPFRPLAVVLASAIAMSLAFAPGLRGEGHPAVYVGLLGAVAALGTATMLGWPRAEGRRLGTALLCAGILLAAGTVDAPAVRLSALADRWLDKRQEVHQVDEPTGSRGVTRQLATGLMWIRDHTPSTTTLAVNNHLSDPRVADSRYFYYSALAERRVFLESWGYTDQALAIGSSTVREHPPFPRRLAINDAAFRNRAGTGGAVSALRARGVDYLVVDRAHGPVPRAAPPLTRRVFANSAVDVYRLRGG